MLLIIGVMPKFLWGFLRVFYLRDISLTDVVKCGKQFFLFELDFYNWCWGVFCLNVCVYVQIKRGLKGE